MDPNFPGDLNQASSQGGDPNAKKRRAKGEAGEGNFICGCGKAYLSYPALYTHIKTKHDGVTPAGTTQPQSNNKSGRGRPKKGESGHKPKEEEEKDMHNENNDNQMAYGDILNYFKILELEYKYDDQSGDLSSIVSTIPDNFDLVASFPVDILRQPDYAPVLAELENIVRTKTIGEEEMEADSGLKKTNMNRIFAIFIYLIGRHLKERFYREFVFFLMMYRRALNELGWKVKESNSNGFISETKKETEFCSNNNAEFAPEVSNDFITEKWPKYVPQYALKGFKVLGTDLESTKNAVFLTKNFCNWLSLQGYTDFYLSINEEEAA